MSTDGSSSASGATGTTSGPGGITGPAEASLIGEVLDGRYRVVKKIGEGGMGEVYAAEHVHIEKRFAVKLLRPEIVSNPEAVTRFRQEARSASSIGHNNIIAIEDFGQLPDGRIYMCMELLNGAPLNDMLVDAALQPPLTVERLLNILIQTGHGLAAAHHKGIVHRDMKPENIYVTVGPNGEDIPKLLDFGIAKVSGNDGQNNLTRTGTIFGTPFYMSPEQALGQGVDARADIYAMGVIMYEVFSGTLPFQGESFMGILTQHITTEPEPVAQRAAKAGRTLPPGLANIIVHAMQKDPNKRFQTMDAMVQALVDIYRAVGGSGMSAYMEAFPVGKSQPVMMIDPRTGQPTPSPSVPTLLHHGTPQPAPASTYGQGLSSVEVLPQDANNKKSKVGLIVGILAVLLIGGGVAAFVLFGNRGATATATTPSTNNVVPPPSHPVAAAAGPDAGIAVAAADAATAAAITPDAIAVQIKASNVSKFVVEEDGVDLGEGPQKVDITPGKPRTFSIRANGYKTATVLVDGGQPVVAVSMEVGKSVRPPPPVHAVTAVPVVAQPPEPIDPNGPITDINHPHKGRQHPDAEPIAPPDSEPVTPRPAKMDCSERLQNVRDARCRRQYCRSHGDDPKCDLE